MIYNKLKKHRGYNFQNKNKNLLGISIGVFIMLLFLSINILNNAKAEEQNKYKKRNMFYIQIINYTMPVIKVSSFDEEDMAENQFSVKSEIMSCFGIDINNPMQIIGKEVSYFNNLAFNGLDKKSGDTSVNNFNLDDKDISKETGTDNTSQPIKVGNVYNPNLKKTLDTSKPEILIYHSHTTESYKPYGPDTLEPTQNVCAVGDEIVKELKDNYGISAINDKTVHNAAAYNKSYTRSGETLDKYLKQYGDFKMIIDLHRDSIENKSLVTTKINGESVAKFMFVMARKNPHYDKNIAMVNSLVEINNKLFPGLCSGIYYYDYGTNYFNQAKSNNAFLLEIGSDCNELTEAKATAKYLARIFAEYLNGKK